MIEQETQSPQVSGFLDCVQSLAVETNGSTPNHAQQFLEQLESGSIEFSVTEAAPAVMVNRGSRTGSAMLFIPSSSSFSSENAHDQSGITYAIIKALWVISGSSIHVLNDMLAEARG